MKTYGSFKQRPDYTKILAALDRLDSHGIYSRGEWSRLLEEAGINVSLLPHHSAKEVKQQIKKRGVGGWVNDTDEELFSGYLISEGVLRLLGHEPDGMKFYGRGSAHRANVEQIRKLAEA